MEEGGYQQGFCGGEHKCDDGRETAQAEHISEALPDADDSCAEAAASQTLSRVKAEWQQEEFHELNSERYKITMSHMTKLFIGNSISLIRNGELNSYLIFEDENGESYDGKRESSSRLSSTRFPSGADAKAKNTGNPPDVVSTGSIEWGPLLVDSTKFLLFQHGFRLATEKDTRAGLSGPFFRDYSKSVLNIHGWNDGDPFFVNYIDHPMEGSVAGYIEIAHDPRYRQAEFGRTSLYWKSRLRATAFSAAYSLQFEIGPVSEASLGNIQENPKKTGVVDWVITPVAGMGWMIGEDALDRYVIRSMEIKTSSPLKRALLRSILNPTRSLSNMFQGKRPWYRETRPGITEF